MPRDETANDAAEPAAPMVAISCPHRPPCGGCALLDLPLDEQLGRKREVVAQALARFPALRGADVRPCVPAPSPVGYRSRAKFAVDRPAGGRRARIGLFRPATHEVVDLPGCRVLHPALLPILDRLRELLGASPLPFVHVDLRWSLAESRAHVTLVAGARLGPAAVRPIAEALMVTHPEVAGVGLRSAGEGPVPRALTGATVSVAGRPHLEETIGRARFRLSPGAFFQVDPAAAARVHDVVREWLADPQAGPAAHLCDLYAGVGAFAIALADTAERTTAVESVAAATDDAAASADLSGVRVRVVRSPVERFLGGIGPDPPFGRGDGRSRGVGHDPPDRVVLDPPRRGVPLGVLRALGAVAPVRLAYVSCDPETLARDLDALVPHGLVAGAVAPVDMFSLTDEVEAVALIGRRERPWQPVVHHAGSDVVAAEKPAVLPTHPQGPGEASLRDAVRAATGLRDLEPAHRLDVGTSGPVLFARGEALRALGRAFETGAVDKEYLALVRGVPRRAGTIRIAAEGGRRGAPEATRYRREDVVGGYGLLRVFPGTGRRHQIRRHLQRIGHPVLGDDRYGDPRANRFLADTCALARPFLHLAAVAFTTEDGSRRRIESPLPPELELVLDRLRRLRGDFPPRDDGQG